LKSNDTRFLLRPDSDFFKFFSNSSGIRAEEPSIVGSDEGPVMGPERRRWVIAADLGHWFAGEEPFVQ
jgi:hypothetical protein